MSNSRSIVAVAMLAINWGLEKYGFVASRSKSLDDQKLVFWREVILHAADLTDRNNVEYALLNIEREAGLREE